MATARWRDWDRRLIGWFLVALLVLVALVANPLGDGGDGGDDRGAEAGTVAGAARTGSPERLCGSLNRMAQLRDDLVDGTEPTTIDDLREAAADARGIGARTRGLDPQSQAGLDYFTGLFLALPDRPTDEQLLSSGSPASITDQAHADAFVGWLQGSCPTGSPGPAAQ